MHAEDAIAFLDRGKDALSCRVVGFYVSCFEAVPLSVENAIAAAASYRAGKMELGTLLVIRREVLDTRREHLDRLLAAALAAVDLWITRGAATIP
jgi:hypothetical protein